MAEITAAAVKALRDRTGLPMMECKRALQKTGGDAEAAIEELRKAGQKVMASRSDRETAAGRIAVSASLADSVGAMVELRCESAPVQAHEDFVQLANDLAAQLAKGPGAATPDELLSQPSPSASGQTLGDQLGDLQNRMREVFRVARILRIDGPCGGYAHHTGEYGVLTNIEGGDEELAKDVSMHVAAMKPAVARREDLDEAEVARERDILMEAARTEGKPENILEKMVEGRMRTFYEQKVLVDQPFVKDDKQTVGKLAKARGAKIVQFVLWQLGAGG